MNIKSKHVFYRLLMSKALVFMIRFRVALLIGYRIHPIDRSIDRQSLLSDRWSINNGEVCKWPKNEWKSFHTHVSGRWIAVEEINLTLAVIGRQYFGHWTRALAAGSQLAPNNHQLSDSWGLFSTYWEMASRVGVVFDCALKSIIQLASLSRSCHSYVWWVWLVSSVAVVMVSTGVQLRLICFGLEY